MTEMKHYMEIPRIGHKTTEDFFVRLASKGLDISVAVKLDGANAQFEANEQGDLMVYSRRNIVDEEKNLNGFYQYVQDKVDPTRIPTGYKIFGEWLVSHIIKYPQDAYRHFYLFDIYDSVNGVYISHDSEVFQQIHSYLVGEIGMKEEMVLYKGPYKGIEHLNDLLKQVTRTGVDYDHVKQPESFDDVFHEGLVVKSTDYRDQYGHQLFVKLVGERFQEVKKVKLRPKTPKGPDVSVEGQIVEFAVTKARIEKMLYKLVDESVLQQDFDLEDMNVIARNLPKRVYEDVIKEELDTIQDQFGEFDEKLIGKKMSGRVMSLAKSIIMEKVEERAKNL